MKQPSYETLIDMSRGFCPQPHQIQDMVPEKKIPRTPVIIWLDIMKNFIRPWK